MAWRVVSTEKRRNQNVLRKVAFKYQEVARLRSRSDEVRHMNRIEFKPAESIQSPIIIPAERNSRGEKSKCIENTLYKFMRLV